MDNQGAESDSSPKKPAFVPGQSSDPNASPHEDAIDDADKNRSKLKELWRKTELDVPTLMMMFKAAVPPTISVAFFQADPVAKQYGTVGYLVGIASILGFCIIPRAKFIQTMLLNIIAVCIASAVGLLATWSALQARLHTTPVGHPPAGYNASASAVSAVWLFFLIFVVNSLRSARPQLQFPVIIFSIFIDIVLTNAPILVSTMAIESFIKRILAAWLTGFALSTGANLFIFPLTSRKVIFKEMTGYLKALSGTWRAQLAYIQAFHRKNLFAAPEESIKDPEGHGHTHGKSTPAFPVASETKAVKDATIALIGAHGKVRADLTFGKREMAIGKLSGSDLSEMFRLLRLVLLPTIGMSSSPDIFERLAHFQRWNEMSTSTEKRPLDIPLTFKENFEDWQSIMQMIHGPFKLLIDSMCEAVEHVCLRLELEQPAKKFASSHNDIEANAETSRPGSETFAKSFERTIDSFDLKSKESLQSWCHEKGVNVPEDAFETLSDSLEDVDMLNYGTVYERYQRQAFMILYMQYLIRSSSLGVLRLVHFADSKVNDGTMTKNRFIAPPYRRVKKWITNVLGPEDASSDDHRIMAEIDGTHDVDLGQAFGARRDPEHLPPATTFERLGNYIRLIPGLLRSPHAAFGFRAAVATMTVAIVNYLRSSQAFYIEQRIVWALIMITFSMTRTSGASMVAYVLRVVGTVAAMVASYVVWYIVDGKTPGVIVFLFVWMFMCFYIPLKKPQYVIVGIITAVTTLLIIGYELQVEKLGVKASAASGQTYYPIYTLAPFRLACVAGGLFVAYIWTIFPYPITESSELRRSLGGSLFLLANYYAIVHSTVTARLSPDTYTAADLHAALTNKPRHALDRARSTVFSKTQLLIQKLRSSYGLTSWQLGIGGRFPSETYGEIIKRVERILLYTALIGFASASFSPGAEEAFHIHTADGIGHTEESEWQRAFKKLAVQVSPTAHEITSRLALLSSSVTNGTPLPPYLQDLEGFHLMRRLRELDPDVLSVKHLDEPGYAAFAVLQVSARSVVGDLNELTELVRALVGELDFSVRSGSNGAGKGGKVD